MEMFPCGKTSQPPNRTKIGLLSLWILNTDFLTSSRPDPFSSPFSQGARTMSCSEKILDSVYSDDLVDFWWCWNLSWCLFRLWLKECWCKCWRKKRPKNRRISARDADLLNPSAFNLGCVGGVLGERRLENAQFSRLEQNFTMVSFVLCSPGWRCRRGS